MPKISTYPPAPPSPGDIALGNHLGVTSVFPIQNAPGASAAILATDSAGNVSPQTVKSPGDIFPVSDTKGLMGRFVNADGVPTDHFRGALPAGFSWQGAPFVTGSNGSAYYNDYYYMNASAINQRLFFSKPITNAAASWQNKIFSSRMRAGNASLIGVRVDDGSDNNYVEGVLDGTAFNATQTLKWRTRTGGAAPVISTSAIVLPITQYLSFKVSCYYAPVQYTMYIYVIGEEGDNLFLYALNISWAPAAGRVGFVYESSANGSPLGLADWFNNSFT